MEANNKADSEYIKGFEEGYRISRYLPEISEWMARKKNTSLKYSGFLDGRIKCLVEQVDKLVEAQAAWEWDDDE